MNAQEPNATMAVYLDLENIALGALDAHYPTFSIQKVLERLLLKGHIVVKKAYCDFDRYKVFKREVIQSMVRCYEEHYANVHRGIHQLAQESDELFDQAREKVRAFINAPQREQCGAHDDAPAEQRHGAQQEHELEAAKGEQPDPAGYLMMQNRSIHFPGRHADQRDAFLEQVRYNTYFLWLEKALQRIYGFEQSLSAQNWEQVFGWSDPVQVVTHLRTKLVAKFGQYA